MPYMKYKNWYVPNCEIAFPTEEEAWEYLEEMEQERKNVSFGIQKMQYMPEGA